VHRGFLSLLDWRPRYLLGRAHWHSSDQRTSFGSDGDAYCDIEKSFILTTLLFCSVKSSGSVSNNNAPYRSKNNDVALENSMSYNIIVVQRVITVCFTRKSDCRTLYSFAPIYYRYLFTHILYYII